jgi:mono/diheme cytochrome c family protein
MNGFRLRRFFLPAFFLLGFLQGCDYGRMHDQEFLRPYEGSMPDRPAGTMPADGGLEFFRSTSAEDLTNPLTRTRQTVEQGAVQYEHFCIFCHGPGYDGRGTVGQSFYPLPTDLGSPSVQIQADGVLFKKIALGFRRHPPMAHTVSAENLWAVVVFLRNLEEKAPGAEQPGATPRGVSK